MRVCVDVGHTGFDPGAVGVGGITEAEINLQVSQYLRDWLTAKGHEVMLTREGPDASVDDLWARVALAIDFAAEVLISIHCNSFGDYRAHGYEIWTLPGQDNSDVLATEIYHSLQTSCPDMSGRADFADGDPDKEARFGVLKGPMPSVLVEIGFVSNPFDAQIITDPIRQQQIAEAIGTGLLNWAALQ